MRCNVCGSTEFEDFNNRPFVRCKSCGSLERTRLLALYLAKLAIPQGASVLHIAPEKGIFDLLSRRTEIVDYVVADLNPEIYSFVECSKIDLCNLREWPADRFDLVIHSHVLEHVLCTVAYPLYHIHRMLKSSGRHIFIVPFATGKYEESFRDLRVEERIKRFGQWDHVRRFGRADVEKHLGKIVRLPAAFDATSFAEASALEEANVPASHWTGIGPCTVIDIGKDDYLLS
jgi:phosphoglycolate phosphatase